MHRIGDAPGGPVGLSVEEVERFFLEDPEGIATVSLPGSWREKLAEFTHWWRWDRVPPSWATSIGGILYPKPQHRRDIPTRIPSAFLARAHVPYHLGVTPDGRVVQWLPLESRSAHARGWNHTACSIAVLRPSEASGPLPAGQAMALRSAMVACTLEHPELTEWVGHDDANRRRNLDPKGCPGFDVEPLSRWVMRAVEHIQDGAARR